MVSETTLLQTEKADLSTELTSKEIVNLPLNQFRNYQKLIDLVPGATPAQFQNAEIDTPGRSLRTWVNGVQPNSNTTRIDGAVSVNVWLPHHVGLRRLGRVDRHGQHLVQQLRRRPGHGRRRRDHASSPSPAPTSCTARPSCFHNNEGLNANSLFNNAFGLAKPDLKKNIYGATLGGPIVKNKLFFFGSWERYSRDNKYNQTFGVPTEKMRAGDFSEVAAAYSSFRLYNPYTGGAGGVGREQFANYTIPANLISPQAKEVLPYYPLPNTAQDLNSNQIADDYVITAHPVPAPRQLRPEADLPAQRSRTRSGPSSACSTTRAPATTSSSASTTPRSATPASTWAASATPGRSARPSCSTATSATSR